MQAKITIVNLAIQVKNNRNAIRLRQQPVHLFLTKKLIRRRYFLETTIELCEAKDHTLTILITGKRAKVEEARARIIRDLQMQATREIVIPKEHHRVLIGMFVIIIFTTYTFF